MTKTKDSWDRACELLSTPENELPVLALAYRNHLFKQYSGCLDVAATAFAHYAEVIEGFPPCEDDGYWADTMARQWLEGNEK